MGLKHREQAQSRIAQTHLRLAGEVSGSTESISIRLKERGTHRTDYL